MGNTNSHRHNSAEGISPNQRAQEIQAQVFDGVSPEVARA